MLLKESLEDTKTMTHWKQFKKARLTVDASPFALGSILEQKLEHSDVYKVIAYTSRSLTEVERHHSQTESEALAVIWVCEYFRLFLVGVKFELFTAHKALLVYQSLLQGSKDGFYIYNRLLDALLSHSMQSEIGKSRSFTDEYVNFIIERRSQSIDIGKIRHETQMDDTLYLVIKAVKDNNWPKNSPTLHPFSKISLFAKQHSFKERQNRATKNLIQKGSITSTPKPFKVERTKHMLRESFW